MSWEAPKEYEGCAFCGTQGPFKREHFTHYVMGDHGMSEGDGLRLLLDWVASEGFVPEAIKFGRTDDQDWTYYFVNLITRYVSYHSGWYNHMKDPKREEWEGGLKQWYMP